MTPTSVRIDAAKIVRDYHDKKDIAKENANSDVGPSGLMMTVGSEGLRRYTLQTLKEEGFFEIVDLHHSGAVHIHDLGMGIEAPYCCGNSLPNLLATGMSIGVSAGPANHLNSAINQMVNFIGTQSNDYSGAQAFNGVDTYLAPYAYKMYLDFKKEGCAPATAFRLARRDVYQAIQNFIFHLNYSTRYGQQKPFSNISLDITIPYDMEDQLALIAGIPVADHFDYTVDGVRVNNTTYGQLWEWQRLVAEAFLDTFNKGDADGRGFTFPVLTLNVVDEFFDHPLTNKICEFTAKYGIPFFQNFINGVSGGERTDPKDVRAMCPLHPSEKIMVKSSKHQRPSVLPISRVYTGIRQGVTYQVLMNGKWEDCGAIQVPKKNPLTITLANGVSVRMDGQHLQPMKKTKGGSCITIPGHDLIVGDYLPFATESFPDTKCNREAGYIVGAFAGDGSYNDSGALVFSLNNTSKKVVQTRVVDFFEAMGYHCKVTNTKREVFSVYVGGNTQSPATWMQQYIPKATARDKEFTPHIYSLGAEFLEGILEGWYATDGGNRGHIYTGSEKMCEDFKDICGVLGKGYVVDMEGDTREGCYGTEPIYTLKYHSRDNYEDFFFTEDNMRWFPISKIESTSNKESIYYCLTVDSDDRLFQLANGLITHNCRLSLSLSDISKKTGGLFGASDNTGSIMNITVNLPYIAEETKGLGISAFYTRLHEVMELVREVHQWKRKRVTEALDKGYLSLSKQVLPHKYETFFTTVGFIGEWEAVEILTGDELSLLTPEGITLGKEILQYMVDTTKEWSAKYEALWNLEESPAESASYKLAAKSLKQFPDIKHRGTKKAPYFTNGCNIPAEYQNDISQIIKVRSELQPIPTGGTATHFYVAEKWTAEQVKEFIKTICQTPIPYFSISTVYSICPICGYHVGVHETCPNEHSPAEIAELKRKYPDKVV